MYAHPEHLRQLGAGGCEQATSGLKAVADSHISTYRLLTYLGKYLSIRCLGILLETTILPPLLKATYIQPVRCTSVQYLSSPVEFRHDSVFSEVSRRLLDNGFSPKSNHGGFDLNQNEALRWAATFGFVNLVEALVRLGADLESKDENGHSAFHLAAKDEPDGAGKVLNFLAKVKPGLVEDKDKDGLTALHLAALNGHLEALKALVLSDANVFAVTKNGWTALHQAARTGRCSIIQLLLVECGAEINCRDESGWSPLHLACINGYLEAAKQLIELGSDID